MHFHPRNFPSYLSGDDRRQLSRPHSDDNHHFLISRVERSAWTLGVLITLALIVLISWTTRRDEAGRRLYHSLAAARCPAPNAPLEKFLLSIASDADGGAPALTCVYITSSLGTVPQLRYERPTGRNNSERAIP